MGVGRGQLCPQGALPSLKSVYRGGHWAPVQALQTTHTVLSAERLNLGITLGFSDISKQRYCEVPHSVMS